MTAFKDDSFTGDTLFGTFYPTGYITAVTHGRPQAEAAQTALQEAGFDDIRIWSAEDVQARHQAFLSQRSMIQRISAAFAADEKLVLDDYLQAAEEGHTFLTVHIPDEAQVNQARDILVAHHAHQMHYYSPIGITDLTP
jgi:hypothetical protein